MEYSVIPTAYDKTVISARLAWQLRIKGLQLAPNSEYRDQRVAEIAQRQRELFVEIAQLDVELRALAVADGFQECDTGAVG